MILWRDVSYALTSKNAIYGNTASKNAAKLLTFSDTAKYLAKKD
jgi:hypothetical protein